MKMAICFFGIQAILIVSVASCLGSTESTAELPKLDVRLGFSVMGKAPPPFRPVNPFGR
jgi:hypothetical protein